MKKLIQNSTRQQVERFTAVLSRKLLMKDRQCSQTTPMELLNFTLT